MTQPRPRHLAIYTDAGELGGAEMVLGRLLRALPPQVELTLVGTDRAVLDWLAGHRPGSEALHVDAIGGRADLRGMLGHRRLFRRLQRRGVDAVQFNLNAASSCQWALVAAASIPRLPVLALEHSPMPSWSSFSTRLKRLTDRRVVARVSVGNRAARLIEESNGLTPGSVRVIHHGIEEVERREVQRPEEPTVLTVSRHDPVKGVDVLIEAMAKVAPPVRAVVIGSGSRTAELEQLRDQLALGERVELRQPAPGDMGAAGEMWAYDGLVLPSRLEGFPVTVLEAMFAGIPVIATDVGSVREQVEHGVTGWVVPPEDPAALAAAIDELCADRERAREMGARGREVALERFTMQATIGAWMDLYDEVLG